MDFVTVAQVTDVAPGTVSRVKAGEVEIALVNLDGEFYALQGHCLHLKGPLGEACSTRTTTSPAGTAGRRPEDGQERLRPRDQAQTYEVKVEDGEVKVGLD